MNHSEVAKLLTLAAAYDQRTIGEADVLAWHELLSETNPRDAAAVVKTHYATKRERLMPIDVIEGVRKIRHDRLERLEHEATPPPGLDDAGYRRWLRETRTAIADGTWTPPPPIEGRPMPPELGDTFRRPDREDDADD